MVVSWTHLKMQYRGNYRRSIIGYLASMLMGNTMGKVNLMNLMPIRGEYPHPIAIITQNALDVVKHTMTYADYRPRMNIGLSSSDLVYKDCLSGDIPENPVLRALDAWIVGFKRANEIE
uniref:Uncharacterized protein n=1 Tax=Myoviridae sp. ctxjh1 TaxID=2826714 RepID=A0A8S5R0S9_9CAUD|nr:MAG TPA: hypothetical protein [Myoviridae sp. ctxjh1]